MNRVRPSRAERSGRPGREEVRMEYLEQIGRQAKEAEATLRTLGGARKDEALLRAAEALMSGAGRILQANARDMEAARERGTSQGLLDGLRRWPRGLRRWRP